MADPDFVAGTFDTGTLERKKEATTEATVTD